jgi:hypothetical protein
MAPAKTPCLRLPVDAAPALVDVAVLDNSVPDGTGAVRQAYTDQPPKQVLTTVSNLLMAPAKTPCLRLTVDAAPALVDVPVLDNSVPDGTGAVRPTYTDQPPKQVLTTVSNLLMAPAKTPCLRLPVDAAPALVDVAVMDNSVPDGTGAVRPTYTDQPPKQVLTTVAQAECLRLPVNAAPTMVDVLVMLEDSVPDGTGAVRPTYTDQPPKQLITPVRAPINPRFIATNHFKVRLAKKICV